MHSGIDITRGGARDIDLALITSENLFMGMGAWLNKNKPREGKKWIRFMGWSTPHPQNQRWSWSDVVAVVSYQGLFFFFSPVFTARSQKNRWFHFHLHFTEPPVCWKWYKNKLLLLNIQGSGSLCNITKGQFPGIWPSLNWLALAQYAERSHGHATSLRACYFSTFLYEWAGRGDVALVRLTAKTLQPKHLLDCLARQKRRFHPWQTLVNFSEWRKELDKYFKWTKSELKSQRVWPLLATPGR